MACRTAANASRVIRSAGRLIRLVKVSMAIAPSSYGEENMSAYLPLVEERYTSCAARLSFRCGRPDGPGSGTMSVAVALPDTFISRHRDDSNHVR
jgi:hypothetical protein